MDVILLQMLKALSGENRGIFNDVTVKYCAAEIIFGGSPIMNKTELIAEVAAKAEITKKDADAAVTAVIDTITEALVNGDKVQLVGFGTFEVRERSARTGRDPRTNKAIEIPASKAPAFKAGKALKDSVNK